ncbi:CYTH and CHAD domain-containing protein [Actinotalea sp. K2]|uniref:CYTH and CHAD domain-containing protein n=1 Tax=Actinotalea sp. K2 TaxID=2939438 RepID=UPI002017213A|nr:CYTH and CHAD domain-containing protein [Actinotalea sp. K2]MCL3859628.1 CYTH and CHAD domain-containing protein [Actinotalea sp. K2]
MVHDEIEREIKLEAPADAVPVPDLSGLPGVADVRTESHHLVATYFDTADLALVATGATLRRRTGGPDEGWHLKRPTGDGARAETRLPLGRAVRTVPATLRAQVRAVVRNRPLVAVATVVNERVVHLLLDAQGRVLAEVCDDHVTGTTLDGIEGSAASDVSEDSAGSRGSDRHRQLTWREWEVELRDGDPSILETAGSLLTGAGAVPASSASKLDHVLATEVPAGPRPGLGRRRAGAVVWSHLAEQVTALTDRDPEVRADQPDAVHQMRVASRRLRSALRTFRPLLDRSVTDPLRADLKELGEVLGRARDAEVMRDRLAASLAEQDVELVIGPVRRRLRSELDDRYRQALRDVVAYLDTEHYLSLLDQLDHLVDSPPWTDLARKRADAVLPRRVEKAYRDLADLSARARRWPPGPERDAALHECRKAAKRTRYASEVLVAVAGRPATRFAAAMEEVQDALGEHHDSVVAQALTREIGVRAHLDGENAFTWGLLHALEGRRRRDADAAFERAWRAASRKKLRRWM